MMIYTKIVKIAFLCVMLPLIAGSGAVTFLIRAPFQVVAWLLGSVLDGLAALCLWMEEL